MNTNDWEKVSFKDDGYRITAYRGEEELGVVAEYKHALQGHLWEAYITEQRRRAKEEAVEYIKLHSPKLHATGGYEVKNEILHEATREGE